MHQIHYVLFLTSLFCLSLVSCSANRPDVVSEKEPVQGEVMEPPPSYINSLGIEMLLAPAGVYTYGSQNWQRQGADQPKVVEMNRFYASRGEVTLGQFKEYLDDEGLTFSDIDCRQVNKNPELSQEILARDMLAVGTLTLERARLFCKWLSKKEGVVYRLPTEYEWEYIARAGTETLYWWGNGMLPYLTTASDYSRGIIYSYAPEGVYPYNPWGFSNVYGSAQEWCDNCEQRPGYTLRGGSVSSRLFAHNSFFNGRAFKPLNHRGGIRLVCEIGADGFRLPPKAQVKSPNASNDIDSANGEEVLKDSLLPTQKVVLGEGVDLELIKVPAGSFQFGSTTGFAGRSDWEDVATKINISQDFYMGKYEITASQYGYIFSAMKDQYRARLDGRYVSLGTFYSKYTGRGDLPARSMSWLHAYYFCELLTLHERAAGRLSEDEYYRLPFEWEWEYCAKAGTETVFHFGDNHGRLSDYAWYGDPGAVIHPVGLKRPNPWGFHDLYGNVYEWTLSFGGDLNGGVATDPYDKLSNLRLYTYRADRSIKVVRGGATLFGWIACRSTARLGLDPEFRMRYPFVGFRVVRSMYPPIPLRVPPIKHVDELN